MTADAPGPPPAQAGDVLCAVDIGTNSVRLLVAQPQADGELRVLDRRVEITRLGQGVDRARRLDPAAVARTLQVLRGYHDRWQELGAARVSMTATSAARDAEDAEAFRDAVVQATGVAPMVIPGEREAALAFDGAVSGLRSVRGPVLVLDIGGGSTEVVRGVDAPFTSTSRQLGSVRLTEMHLHDDPPTVDQVRQAVATVDAQVEEIVRLVGPQPGDVLVGTAGTITTIAAVHLGLGEWRDGEVHGTRMPAEAVTAIASRLCAMSAAERAALPAIPAGRADVIAAGALILDRIVSRLGTTEVRVSETDILDGILRAMR